MDQRLKLGRQQVLDDVLEMQERLQQQVAAWVKVVEVGEVLGDLHLVKKITA